MKGIKLLGSLLLLASNCATASILQPDTVRLTFGGLSKHLAPLSEGVQEDIQYNETHGSIGLELMKFNESRDWFYGIGTMYMTDSYNEPAFTLGANIGYHWDVTSKLEFNLGLIGGLQARSYIVTHNDRYLGTERTVIPFVAPQVSFSYYNVGGSLITFPQIETHNDKINVRAPVLFFQFHIDF